MLELKFRVQHRSDLTLGVASIALIRSHNQMQQLSELGPKPKKFGPVVPVRVGGARETRSVCSLFMVPTCHARVRELSSSRGLRMHTARSETYMGCKRRLSALITPRKQLWPGQGLDISEPSLKPKLLDAYVNNARRSKGWSQLEGTRCDSGPVCGGLKPLSHPDTEALAPITEAMEINRPKETHSIEP